MKKSEKKYYNFMDDLEEYPDAWCFMVWSKRGPGKTYGTLLGALEEKHRIIYLKRLKDDVNLLLTEFNGTDLSPYKPINRDTRHNVKPVKLRDGIGFFYEFEDNEPMGPPVAYCLSLSMVSKYKGFELSDCDWIVFDEVLPQLGERFSKKEGEQLMDLVLTVNRDREARGLPGVKLIMFSNATNVSTPVTNILEITDDMAELDNNHGEYKYLEDRGILLHRLPPNKYARHIEQTGIYRAMHNTAWGKMAFGSEFGYNDFSNTGKIQMKELKPLIHLHYKNNDYYIYERKTDHKFYMTYSGSPKCRDHYDLNRENDQKRFYEEWYFDLRQEIIHDNMIFEKYSMYDLIINYKQFFVL